MITLKNIAISNTNNYYRHKADILIDDKATGLIIMTESSIRLKEEDLILIAEKEYKNYINPKE